MHPVAHAALGAVLFGPVGAVASVVPDAPLVAAWACSKGNRVWLPREHWSLRWQARMHSLWAPVAVVGWLVYPAHPAWAWPVFWSWVLHILTDYVTHHKELRWPLL